MTVSTFIPTRLLYGFFSLPLSPLHSLGDKSGAAFAKEVQYDAGIAVRAGYGEGKYVAERVSVLIP